MEEGAAGGPATAAVGEQQAPRRLDLLGPRQERAGAVGAEPADDAADLPERAAFGLVEPGGDLLGGPSVLRPQAWACRGERAGALVGFARPVGSDRGCPWWALGCHTVSSH